MANPHNNIDNLEPANSISRLVKAVVHQQYFQPNHSIEPPSVVWRWKLGTTYVTLFVWHFTENLRFRYRNMGWQLHITDPAILTFWFSLSNFFETFHWIIDIYCMVFMSHYIMPLDMGIIPWCCREVCRPVAVDFRSLIII